MENQDYNISFFKPTTKQAKINRNLTLVLVIIWAIAIYGFHFLLKAVEKPVPEEALGKFEAAWSNMESGTATGKDYQAMSQAMLQVMGKSTIKPEQFEALQDGVGWSLAQLQDQEANHELQEKVNSFITINDTVTSLTDKAYLDAKTAVKKESSAILGLGQGTLLEGLLPLALDGDITSLSDENKTAIPGIMKLYLVHNRSFLTDTTFLGFPFHYFYTAVFLLVLFVGLCWYYCFRTDRVHAKLNIEEIHD